MRRAALLAPLAALLGAAAPLPPLATADAPPYRYTVQPRDTLWGVAARGLNRASDWPLLAHANHVADPRHLATGRTLTIPAALLKTTGFDATLVAFSGDVTIGGQMARAGQPVAETASVATGPGSFATLSLADGSRVTIPSQSRLRIERLRLRAIDGSVDRRFLIESGRGEFAVTPRRSPQDRFLVRTPVAVAAVRGTEFRVSYAPAAALGTLSVTEGVVASRPGSARADTDVAAGNGAAIGAASLDPAALLAAPALADPDRAQDDPALIFRTAGSAAARIRIARDAGFIDNIAEADTAGGEARFTGIGNGTFFARLTALDGRGVEGLPATYAFERRLNTLSASAGAAAGSRFRHRYLFRWQSDGEGTARYDFVLARDAALADRLFDEAGLAGTELTAANLGPGTYYWRVTVNRSAGGRIFSRALPVQSLVVTKPKRG